jgi:inner membrane protein
MPEGIHGDSLQFRLVSSAGKPASGRKTMDSLTQAVLGAGIAAAIAPAEHRRKALLIGAVLGTLPDLDVFIDYGDAVRNFTYHRSFSHSLFVLAPVSVLLWLALQRLWSPAQHAQSRWLLAISLALMTHPLLDAHTAYGTQLFWPLNVAPTAWGTLFIIDPLYTLPLLVTVIFAAVWPHQAHTLTALRSGVALSTLYLAWSWIAQATVERQAREALVSMNMENAALFITPTPLNTLLWRIVVRTEDGFWEGFDSLVANEPTVVFKPIESDATALREAEAVWAVARLRWFSRGFVKAQVVDGKLVLSDLRMGQEPNYVFSHLVATRGNPQWHVVPSEQIEFSFSDRMLAATWQRIWSH